MDNVNHWVCISIIYLTIQFFYVLRYILLFITQILITILNKMTFEEGKVELDLCYTF